MEQTTPKGATMLKVAGILMIIGGGLSVILSIVAIAGIAALAYIADGSMSMGMLYASGALMAVGSVIELVAGILGVAHSKRAEKATTCVVWGVLVAVMTVASIILTVVGGGEFSAVSAVTGLVLPALYIVGAVQNKR